MPSAKYGSGHLLYPGWVKAPKKTWNHVEMHFDWEKLRVKTLMNGRQVAEHGFRSSGGVRHVDLCSMASVLEPDNSRSVVSCFTDVWAESDDSVRLDTIPLVAPKSVEDWGHDFDDASSMDSFDPMDDDEDYMNDMMSMIATHDMNAMHRAGYDTNAVLDGGPAGFLNLPVCARWPGALPRWQMKSEFQRAFEPRISSLSSSVEAEVTRIIASVAASVQASLWSNGPVRFMTQDFTEQLGLCLDIDGVREAPGATPVLEGYALLHKKEDLTESMMTKIQMTMPGNGIAAIPDCDVAVLKALHARLLILTPAAEYMDRRAQLRTKPFVPVLVSS